MTVDGMLTVRTGSSRLPGKCLLRFDDVTVLEHVIGRCIWFDIDPIVATTNEQSDDVICEIAERMGIRYSRGPTHDKMLRWSRAASQFSVDSFVVVDCDDPMFDPALTHATHGCLIHCGSDYVLPDMSAYIGSHNMAIASDALRRSIELKNSDSTEMIEHHIHDAADVVKFVVNDPHAVEQSIRLTLDYEEDWWLIRTVCREVGRHACRHDIIEFFMKHPGLSTVNMFRHVHWLQHRTIDKDVNRIESLHIH